MASPSKSERVITRTGARVYDPQGSAIYSVNPCPPVKYFSGIKADFSDGDGNKYWLAFAHEALQQWVLESTLAQLIESFYDSARDTLFFVRQNKVGAQKLNCQVFTLPSNNSEIELAGLKKDNAGVQKGVVLEVGQRAANSYSSRGVLWMIVRDLRSSEK
jgi:hypothetical protein